MSLCINIKYISFIKCRSSYTFVVFIHTKKKLPDGSGKFAKDIFFVILRIFLFQKLYYVFYQGVLNICKHTLTEFYSS